MNQIQWIRVSGLDDKHCKFSLHIRMFFICKNLESWSKKNMQYILDESLQNIQMHQWNHVACYEQENPLKTVCLVAQQYCYGYFVFRACST